MSEAHMGLAADRRGPLRDAAFPISELFDFENVEDHRRYLAVGPAECESGVSFGR